MSFREAWVDRIFFPLSILNWPGQIKIKGKRDEVGVGPAMLGMDEAGDRMDFDERARTRLYGGISDSVCL